MANETGAAPAAIQGRAPPPDALFRAAADQAPQVIWIVNAKGAVTYLNHAWYELVGGMPPKWYGHEWGDVVHPDDLAQMREQWTTVGRTGAIFEGRRRVKAHDGRWHILSYRATPVFDEKGLACWVGLDADITELVETQAALRAAKTELEAFSHTVSHDLRGALTTVQGFTEALSRALGDDKDPKVAHYLARIGGAVGLMGSLLDGLLVLARVTGGSLQLEEVDIAELAREVLRTQTKRHPDRRVSTSVQAGLTAKADRRLLAVLMENLLGNAWKFTAKVEHAMIEVRRVSEDAATSVFVVRDNGAGFDMAYADKLYAPFERLHSQDEFPGTGIGLATVSRIVLRHGGRIWAESAPGQGASFYFALPRMGK